jgi:hypothetical protein
MTNRARYIAFIAFAVIAALAILFHIKGVIYPSAVTPAWRHAIFILINAICIYGCLKRPLWFIWFIALLTIQQWYSHGRYAVTIWQTTHQIHWISVADIVLLPLLLVLLIPDKKNK